MSFVLFSLIIALFNTPVHSSGHNYKQIRGNYDSIVDDFDSRSDQARDLLIGGGTEVEKGRYPYAVALYDRFKEFTCTGTLIDPGWVLSAAHCWTNPTPVWVHIGLKDWEDSSEVEGTDYDEIRIESITLHPDYNPNNFQYDFMLLKLERLSQFDPVQLDDGTTQIDESTTFTNFGWGSTETANFSSVLLEVDFNYVNLDECNETFLGEIYEDMFCAGTETEFSGYGDSGGPLFLKGANAGEDLQIGLCSWGRDEPEFVPNVYSWVYKAQDFIASVLNGEEVEVNNDIINDTGEDDEDDDSCKHGSTWRKTLYRLLN